MTLAVVGALLAVLVAVFVCGFLFGRPRLTAAIRWRIGTVEFCGREIEMNLRESQKVSGKYIPTKPDGSPGSIDGAIAVTLDPPDSLGVELGPNPGDFTLLGKTTSEPVPIAVTVTADVDPSGEVVLLPASGSILLLPDVATNAEIVFGTPEPQ